MDLTDSWYDSLDGGSARRKDATYTGQHEHGRAPSSDWIGGCVGPRVGLDDVGKRKSLILPGLEHRPLVVQPVVSRYTDCAVKR
jgi:hypothetical protein